MQSWVARRCRQCLRKDRDTCIQQMDDVKLTLEEVREDSQSGKFDTTPNAVVAVPKKPTQSNSLVLRQLTFDRGLTTDPTLWPRAI